MLGTFYWHSKDENGNTLKEELLRQNKITNIKIASAYFSEEGLEIIKELKDKNMLMKQNIELYLSPEFSLNKPDRLLSELEKICNVFIVFNIKFHPKVYWLKVNSKSMLIFGSSNFTRGGFVSNIEFDIISEVNESTELKLNMFFKYCKSNSQLVNEEIIKFYKDKSEEIDKLKNVSKNIKKILYSYETRNDPFQKDDYDLDQMYFTYEDYETLFLRNEKLNDYIIKSKRKKLRDKLLKIHRKIYPILKKSDIYCHWRDENITSLIRPCEFNFGKVDWIGVRYGKHRNEIEILNEGTEKKNEERGFQKHSCLQFCINSNGFQIMLFHAVRRDAVDRAYLHGEISRLKNRIIKELDKLKGEEFVWIIYDNVNDDESRFEIDKESSEQFIDFYKKYDEEGRESCLSYFLPPDNVCLKDEDSISKLIIKKMKLLLPLYNLLAFRIPGAR